MEGKIEDYTENFWDSRYKNILACNVVIDALPEIRYAEADSGKYNFLASQAYALRAYYYWCLVNLYALPWSEANLDKPGVVIRKEPQIDISARGRSTIARSTNSSTRISLRLRSTGRKPNLTGIFIVFPLQLCCCWHPVSLCFRRIGTKSSGSGICFGNRIRTFWI